MVSKRAKVEGGQNREGGQVPDARVPSTVLEGGQDGQDGQRNCDICDICDTYDTSYGYWEWRG